MSSKQRKFRSDLYIKRSKLKIYRKQLAFEDENKDVKVEKSSALATQSNEINMEETSDISPVEKKMR